MEEDNILTSIIFFAKLYNYEKKYYNLIEVKEIKLLIIESIIKDLFLNEFCFYRSTEEEFKHYNNILNYYKKIRKVIKC
jgi:hypothetical protein